MHNKTGKWKYHKERNGNPIDGYTCSECGFELPDSWYDDSEGYPDINFCPECGAAMQEQKKYIYIESNGYDIDAIEFNHKQNAIERLIKSYNNMCDACDLKITYDTVNELSESDDSVPEITRLSQTEPVDDFLTGESPTVDAILYTGNDVYVYKIITVKF